MQINPVNKNISSSSFKARLSARSIKVLANEAKQFPQEKEILINVLDKFKSFGNKNTLINFSISSNFRTIHYNGTASLDFIDKEDFEEWYKELKIEVSNDIFPNVSYNSTLELNEKDNLFKFLQNCNMEKFVKFGELNLFKKYMTNFKKENPDTLATKETFDMIDIISSAFKPEQTKEMISFAKEIDARSLSENKDKLSTEIKQHTNEIEQLTKRKEKLNRQAEESEKLVDCMSKFLKNESESETREIFNRYI